MSTKRRAGSILAGALLALAIFCAAPGAMAQAGPGPHPDAWLAYHDHQRLGQELTQLAAAFPDLMTLESAGRTAQGRDLWLVTITNRALALDKPKVFFDGSMHGSEVIAAESLLHYIQFLVQEYATNPTAHDIVDGWITYVVPMVNPDGVEAGKSSNDYRLARKNSNLVDLNRNFDWDWGSNPCSPGCFEYPGPSAFSEAESQIIRDQIVARKPLVYLTGHAGLDFEKLIRPGVNSTVGPFFSTSDPERLRHMDVQNCVQSLTQAPDFAGFVAGSGGPGGDAKNWAYLSLRGAGLAPFTFNLEIYTIPHITPLAAQQYWWCRYNPPGAENDSVWQWCLDGTGFPPLDTLVSRMERVKTALIYVTQSATGAQSCAAPAIASAVNQAIAPAGLDLSVVN